MNPDIEALFRAQVRLKNWLLGLLVFAILLSVVSMISGALEHQLLVSIRDGTFSLQDNITARAEASDTRQAVIGGVQFASTLLIFIVWLVWTFKSSKYANALGASETGFTPGWSVGWYFIPFANLVQPYRALVRIIKATRSPVDWKKGAGGMLPLAWWLSFWIDRIADRVSFWTAMQAEEVQELILSGQVSFVSDCLSIVSYALMALLVLRMFGDQRQSANVAHTSSLHSKPSSQTGLRVGKAPVGN
jgi:Ca2+/Na+ antiporter